MGISTTTTRLPSCATYPGVIVGLPVPRCRRSQNAARMLCDWRAKNSALWCLWNPSRCIPCAICTMKKTAAGCIPTPPRINALPWARLVLRVTVPWPSSPMEMAITYRTRPPKFWNNKGLKLRIIDIRWIAPLPTDGILSAINGAQKILIVDECRGTGGQSEALLSMLTERSDLPAGTPCRRGQLYRHWSGLCHHTAQP